MPSVAVHIKQCLCKKIYSSCQIDVQQYAVFEALKHVILFRKKKKKNPKIEPKYRIFPYSISIFLMSFNTYRNDEQEM